MQQFPHQVYWRLGLVQQPVHDRQLPQGALHWVQLSAAARRGGNQPIPVAATAAPMVPFNMVRREIATAAHRVSRSTSPGDAGRANRFQTSESRPVGCGAKIRSATGAPDQRRQMMYSSG